MLGPALQDLLGPNIRKKMLGPDIRKKMLGPDIRKKMLGPDIRKKMLGPALQDLLGPTLQKDSLGPDIWKKLLGPDIWKKLLGPALQDLLGPTLQKDSLGPALQDLLGPDLQKDLWPCKHSVSCGEVLHGLVIAIGLQLSVTLLPTATNNTLMDWTKLCASRRTNMCDLYCGASVFNFAIFMSINHSVAFDQLCSIHGVSYSGTR